MSDAALRCAVVGAGIAGLACARTLAEHGARVTVFERADVPGGRAATLITEAGPFDSGAQYFTAAHDRFIARVRRWEDLGIVERWRGRIVAFADNTIEDKTDSAERYVAVPGMRRIGVAMAQDLEILHGAAVERLERARGQWYLQLAGAESASQGGFDHVFVATPSETGAELLKGHTLIARTAATVVWDPCWAGMLAISHASGADFDGAFINDDPILGWVARDSAKPRRGSVPNVVERWVMHAKPRWSRRYFDLPQAEAARWMARSLSARLRRTLLPLSLTGIRWPHSAPMNPLREAFLWDADAGLGMAGDWCNGPRIEGAYLSGLMLAEAALGV